MIPFIFFVNYSIKFAQVTLTRTPNTAQSCMVHVK